MDKQGKNQCPDAKSRQEILYKQVLLLAEWNEENKDEDIQEVRANIDTMVTLLTLLNVEEKIATKDMANSIEELKIRFIENFQDLWNDYWNRLVKQYPGLAEATD